MHRLANFDVSLPAKSAGGKIAAKLLFGFGCGLAMILLRMALDVVAPTAGPFALVYPTVLLATLYGHWQAGLVAFATTFLWAWYVVLPPVDSFLFAIDTDPSRVLINAISVSIVMIFAETFRGAVRRAAEERDREIERRRMLLAEIEHRTKNNFALVVSLLEMQKRREATPAVANALDQAIGRVTSFSRAYASLSDRQGDGPAVAMGGFLTDLVHRIGAAGFGENVTIVVDCKDCDLPRETAVAIGLFTNEALTNCAKHAFPDDRAGSVAVAFAPSGSGWELSISDDGVGPSTREKSGGGGLGLRLLEAFAQQAGGTYEVTDLSPGRRAILKVV